MCPVDKTHVVIFEGEGIDEFANAAVLKGAVPICKAKSASCFVYDLPGTNVLVIVSLEKNLNKFSLLTALLEPFISKAERISTLTVQPAASHKRDQDNNSDDPVCYLRSLNSKLAGIKPLESPNIITGVVAGVSTWRAFKKLSGPQSFVAFMEAPQYDSYSTKPLMALLNRLQIPCESEYRAKFRADSHNLYM